jgi:hypothetical protein
MAARIAFYITGHGYGHTIRSVEIIKELFRQQSGLTVHVRTSAAEWLFSDLKNLNFYFHSVRLDVGALQSTSFYVDQGKTLSAYADLISRKKSLVRQEIQFLRKKDINLVVSDITPLAFEAAAALQLPGIGEGNFTWDWIYSDWPSTFPDHQFVIDDIRKSYRCADLLLRLPFYGDMSAFKQIVDIPLVARISLLTHSQARQQLANFVDINQKLVLLGMRKADIDQVPVPMVEQLTDYHFITTSPALQAKNITCIPEGQLPFHNMLKGCDVILSKPGYSMVSEIIANQVPLVYVSRNDFREDPILRQALNHYSVCREMSMEDFSAARWQHHLNTVLTKPALWPTLAVNGAEVAAAQILGFEK